MAQIAKVRRPAPVLVDGQKHTARIGALEQTQTYIEIDDKGLLAEYMLSRVDSSLDDRHAFLWVGGDIDDFDIIAREQVAVVEVDIRVWEKFSTARFGALAVATAQRHNRVTGALVGAQVHFGNTAAADQTHSGPIVLRVPRPIGQFDDGGGSHIARAAGLANAVVATVFHVAPAHCTSGNVRFCSALSTAVSTIC